MNTGECIHGFRVRYSQPLPEIGATLWRMEYEKNGADLIWLDRPDDNMTFSIAFKTIPQDSTGVFHILEHSVLNGSEKYPVKEPFVELLKSSMATFLNAMTFSDKTMYPISSRNRQDFLNLIDVYMDAVLHPVSLRDPHAFLQEGWHYELDSPEGELRWNGVVYNEMKGAFASSNTVLYDELGAMLFPDNCYRFSSGGHPEHIPELTYENYLASHRRFYHPSNSYICLDGQVDLDSVLSKLDSFLAPYERIDPQADIPLQAPVAPAERTCAYEIGPEEDEANKAILAGGWVFGDWSETEKSLAFSVLTSALTGTNESPLTKALLDAGLAEDVAFVSDDGTAQLCAMLVIRNTDPAKKEQIWALVERTLADLVDKGLDHKRLHSILNRLEFTTREKDFGGMPRGLVYAITALESWLYGGDPAQKFSYEDVFRSLREKIDAGWFETFLRQVLLDNPHRARLLMLPDKTLGEKKRAREAARLAQIKAGWDSGRIEKVMADFQALRARQSRSDTPEQLASLPVLALSDIPRQGASLALEAEMAEGTTVLNQPCQTGGITYLDLYFSLEDMPLEKLPAVSFLAELLGQVATERYSVLALRDEIEGNLGRFSAGQTVLARPGQWEQATPYLLVSVSLLEDHKADAVRLLGEILTGSRMDDSGYIYNILRQERLGMEQAVAMSGNSYAAMRAGAGCSAKGAVNEAMQGLTLLRWLQRADKAFAGEGEALCRDLAALAREIFVRERVSLSVTGPRDDGFVAAVLGTLGRGSQGPAVRYPLAPARREGFVIPAQIGFAAKASNATALDGAYCGAGRVAGQMLTYGYLWNAVRVKGGAYGVALSVRPDGDVAFSSYRDPSPANTLKTFDGAGAELRRICGSGERLDKYIISTVAATEPLLTPRMEGLRGASLYLSGQSGADLQRERQQILDTTAEELVGYSHVLDRVCAQERVCVIGGKAVVDACDGLDSVESVQ